MGKTQYHIKAILKCLKIYTKGLMTQETKIENIIFVSLTSITVTSHHLVI